MSRLTSRTAFPVCTLLLAVGLASPARAATKTNNPFQQNIPKTFEYSTSGTIRPGAKAGSVQGPNQLAFNGVNSGVYATGSGQTIQLGQFVVAPTKTASGVAAVTTYDGTPFLIQVRAPGYDKSSKVPVLAGLLPSFGKTFNLKSQTLNSLLIRGHLDGTVDPTTGSTVTATVDSVRPGLLGAPPKNTAVKYTFPVRYNDLKLPTSWTMNAAGAATPAGTSTSVAAAATPAAAVIPAPSLAAQVMAVPAAEILEADPIVTTSATPVPTPTPEPSTLLIVAAGAAGLAYARRRRGT